MYTSGSTGTPKGVMVPHRAVVRLVKNTNYLHFGEDEVFLQFSPISFDASTLEIWGALLNGGCLAVAAPGSQSLEAIGAAIARHGVTTAWLTSGLFNLMIEQRPQDLRPLRQLLAGGDALSVVHVRKALENLPHCRLVNGYGPTEGTTFTCCHTIRHEDAQATAIPLGRPIANTQVYVLDENREPVAIREAGELCVGGDGLARGYLHQPELTAERFIANPFSNDPTSKLYRTGDRVRYRGDGTIEFLGRIDDQVKISGYRVEPGEIESVMRQHPEVKDAAVVARQNGAGAKKLLAYVVPRNGHYSAQQLQAYLEQKLPAYMLPSALVRMDALPLSPNGKLDRNALPELGEGSQPLQETARPGRSELEEQIAGVWQKVLGLKEVNLDDNFFDLGGDSLQLLEAHAQLQAGISPEIQVADLFEYSTIRALAHKLAGKAKKDFRAAQRRADQQQAAWARLKENRNQGAR
jgi:aspartate racemase